MNVMNSKKVLKTNFKRKSGFKVVDINNPNNFINQRVLVNIKNNNSTPKNNSSTTTTGGVPARSTSEAGEVILALTEGRGHATGEVGIATIHVDYLVLTLCQISDNLHYSDTLTKIQIFNPSKILVPDTFFECIPQPPIVNLIENYFPGVQLIPIQRRHFHDKEGLDKITFISSRNSKSLLQLISKKYYSLSAANSLLGFMQNAYLMDFAPDSVPIVYQCKKDGILMDVKTSIQLELLYSLSDEVSALKDFSLFNILNFCITRIGKRHLRANILEPTCNIDTIRHRQEQIKVLLENEKVLQEIRMRLELFKSVDQLMKISCITRLVDLEKVIETNINLALLLKNCLEGIKPLANAVNQTISESFESISQILNLEIYDEIIVKINEVLQPDIHKHRLAQKHFQNLYALKSGVDSNVDSFRNLYKIAVKDIENYFTELTEYTHLPLKLIHSPKYGHHLVLKNPTNNQLPEMFEILHRKGSNFYLTTAFLVVLNEKTKANSNNIIRISNEIISELLTSIDIEPIHFLIQVIIDLDIVQSLTQISSREDFCCPTFSKIMRVVSAFNPMLEISKNKNVVTNNIIATPQFNFYVISGPNMSGKTNYLKTVAIIQIIAQIGCFVPAKSAELRIVDRIFSKIGFEDSIEQNASSFMLELIEMEFIYQNLTPNSLLIIDELCRNTNPQDGELICWDYCLKLLNFIGVSTDDYFTNSDDFEQHRKALNENTTEGEDLSKFDQGEVRLKDIARPFIFFTTHFPRLSMLSAKFDNAINVHMVVNKRENVGSRSQLEFTYKINSGQNNVKNYGVSLASCCSFAPSIIFRANELVNNIKVEHKVLMNDTKTSKLNQTTKSNINERSENVSVNQTVVSNDIAQRKPEFLNIYSEILVLFSKTKETEIQSQMKLINKKIEDLCKEISPELEELLKTSTIEEMKSANCSSMSSIM